MSAAPARRPVVRPPIPIPSAPRTAAALAGLDPLIARWPTGAAFFHCYDLAWGPRDFFAGDPAHLGRFHPFRPAGAQAPVPVLYGASDDLGALSETVFHDVPVRGTKHVPRAKLTRRALVELAPTRDLTLIDLTSDGLSRLGLARLELIESDARSYADTAQWARALHAHPAHVDGLTWVSRQHDTSRALVLFGDRVPRDDLAEREGVAPVALAAGAGLDRVCEAADRAGITIAGLGEQPRR
ncbi:MAG TPA: RES family NAD+ phosphorylase [Actinomycetes bacterium]|nr:RES family NAD+ phosphorylase [Actinomycetes bacterium]